MKEAIGDMRKRLTFLLVVVGLASLVCAEPYPKTHSVSNTATRTILTYGTRTVAVTNGGAVDAYFRLFTDIDTEADATAAATSHYLPAGATLTFTLEQGDSESNSGHPSHYKVISAITASSTTTLYIRAK